MVLKRSKEFTLSHCQKANSSALSPSRPVKACKIHCLPLHASQVSLTHVRTYLPAGAEWQAARREKERESRISVPATFNRSDRERAAMDVSICRRKLKHPFPAT